PEQEVIERVLEGGDAADARETPVGKRLRQLRDLRERQRKNGRAAQAPGRDEAVDVNLEIEGVLVDEGKRRERVRRGNGVAAAQERPARFGDDVGRGRR